MNGHRKVSHWKSSSASLPQYRGQLLTPAHFPDFGAQTPARHFFLRSFSILHSIFPALIIEIGLFLALAGVTISISFVSASPAGERVWGRGSGLVPRTYGVEGKVDGGRTVADVVVDASSSELGYFADGFEFVSSSGESTVSGSGSGTGSRSGSGSASFAKEWVVWWAAGSGVGESDGGPEDVLSLFDSVDPIMSAGPGVQHSQGDASAVRSGSGSESYHAGNGIALDSDFTSSTPQSATPSVRPSGYSDDIKLLNFLLVFAHLCSSFYSLSLPKYSEADFVQAGYPDWARGRFEEIMVHNGQHRTFIEGAVLGGAGKTVGACQGGEGPGGYVFPGEGVRSFVDVSALLSGLFVSVLNAGVGSMGNREYAAALASMMGVESRHAAWIGSAVKDGNGWNTAFETPLSRNEAWSIAQNFFSQGCASHYASLSPIAVAAGSARRSSGLGTESRSDSEAIASVMHLQSILPDGLRAYPKLSFSDGVVPGEEAELVIGGTEDGGRLDRNGWSDETLFVVFKMGTGEYVQPLRIVATPSASSIGSGSGSGRDGAEGERYFVAVPTDVTGTGAVYATLVRAREDGERGIVGGLDEEDAVVAGPAVLLFPFDSKGREV